MQEYHWALGKNEYHKTREWQSACVNCRYMNKNNKKIHIFRYCDNDSNASSNYRKSWLKPNFIQAKYCITEHIFRIRMSCTVVRSLPFSSVSLFLCQIPLTYRFPYPHFPRYSWSSSLLSFWRYPFHLLVSRVYFCPFFVHIHTRLIVSFLHHLLSSLLLLSIWLLRSWPSLFMKSSYIAE